MAGDRLPLAPAREDCFNVQEQGPDELIILDYMATGICVRGHPVEHVRARLTASGSANSRALTNAADGAPIVMAAS